MKTIVNTNRSGKFSPPVTPNPRKGAPNDLASAYPGYLVMFDESRLVIGPDEFTNQRPWETVFGLFVLPIEGTNPSAYRISYIGSIHSISEEFTVPDVDGAVRTVRVSHLSKAGMGPRFSRFDLLDTFAWNVRVMNVRAYHQSALIFRPSYDMLVPNVSMWTADQSDCYTQFDSPFDVPQTWLFPLQVGTQDPGLGTIIRSAATESETTYAMSWGAADIRLKKGGQMDDNVIMPLVEMPTVDGADTLPWRSVASFTFPVAGRLSSGTPKFYWVAWFKWDKSMTIEMRFIEHGVDSTTMQSLSQASAIAPTFSISPSPQ